MKCKKKFNKPIAFGQISGKISFSPEQAKRTLDYDIPPEAKGVVFSIVKGEQRIRTLMPIHISSKAVRAENKAFASFSFHALPIFYITKHIWDAYAGKFQNLLGYNLFISENFPVFYSHRSVKPNIRRWKLLHISNGRPARRGGLPAPRIIKNQYCINLTNHDPKFRIGILALEYPSFKFQYVEPKFYPFPFFSFPPSKSNRIIYFFYNNGREYSKSSNIILAKTHSKIRIGDMQYSINVNRKMARYTTHH